MNLNDCLEFIQVPRAFEEHIFLFMAFYAGFVIFGKSH